MAVLYSLPLLIAATLHARVPPRHAVEWPVYGGGPGACGTSSLTEINRDNVTRLKVAWTFDVSDGIESGQPPTFPSLVHLTDRITTPEIRAAIQDGGGRMPGFARLGSEALSAIQRYILTGDDTPTAVAAHGPAREWFPRARAARTSVRGTAVTMLPGAGEAKGVFDERLDGGERTRALAS